MTQDEQLDYFARRYSVLFHETLTPSSERISIGEKDPRLCRYCGKGRPEVTFKKVAHALPEMVGNRWIFALDECDVCNNLFSMAIEDHLAKYIGPIRTIGQISGKTGVPSYKDRDAKSRIDVSAAGFQISVHEDSPMVEHDLENNKLIIRAVRQPYIPMAVYKAFVKMALAVMPLADLAKCKHLCTWVLNSNHTLESLPFKPLMALEQFTPGPNPYGGLSVWLLKRREEVSDCPCMCFVVAFGNMLFQIILPMPMEDKHLMGKPVGFVFFPVPFSQDHQFGPSTRKQSDLHSDQVVRGDEQRLTLAYSNREEMP
jgi:hypothetical protein